ncbi:hypothetical protein [Nocardioides speluncae]|uniref:hypothetical protein n=1 Tax=Nocardioides speluncae TaxID=2670337 RepID=UPI000D69D775|nr:hypothetical protein [Nocardioides speluncae]
MNDNLDLKTRIDEAFGGEPLLPAAAGRLRAGQQARRVRRTAAAGATTALALVVGGAAWAAVDSARVTSDRGSGVAVMPSTSPTDPTMPTSAPSPSTPIDPADMTDMTDEQIIEVCRNADDTSTKANDLFFDQRGGRVAVKVTDDEVFFETPDRSLYGWCQLSGPLTEMAVFRPPPERSSKGLPLSWSDEGVTFVTRLPSEVEKVQIRYDDGVEKTTATRDGWLATFHVPTKQRPRFEDIPVLRITYYGAGDTVLAEWINPAAEGIPPRPGVPDVSIYPSPSFYSQDRLNYDGTNYTD